LLSPFYTEYKVVICFEEVDDSEAVDLVISRFFVDHDVYDSLPASEGAAMYKAIVDDVEVGLKEVLTMRVDLILFIGVACMLDWSGEGFIVSQVASRRGCAGAFASHPKRVRLRPHFNAMYMMGNTIMHNRCTGWLINDGSILVLGNCRKQDIWPKNLVVARLYDYTDRLLAFDAAFL
jgi:hypothetical protein